MCNWITLPGLRVLFPPPSLPSSACRLVASWWQIGCQSFQPSGSQTLFKSRKQGTPVWYEFPHEPFFFCKREIFPRDPSADPQLHVMWQHSFQRRLGKWNVDFFRPQGGSRAKGQEPVTVRNNRCPLSFAVSCPDSLLWPHFPGSSLRAQCHLSCQSFPWNLTSKPRNSPMPFPSSPFGSVESYELFELSFCFLRYLYLLVSWSVYNLKKNLFIYYFIYLFWLRQVLAVARGIFSCGMRPLSCGMWDRVPWPGIEPGPPALGAWSLTHWTTGKSWSVYNFLKILIKKTFMEYSWFTVLC